MRVPIYAHGCKHRHENGFQDQRQMPWRISPSLKASIPLEDLWEPVPQLGALNAKSPLACFAIVGGAQRVTYLCPQSLGHGCICQASAWHGSFLRVEGIRSRDLNCQPSER
jgi:hypothetical protein